MATSRTARKRIRQTKKRRFRNKARTSEIKTLVKKELALVETRDAAKAKELLVELQERLDKASHRHAMHPNTAARKKSRLMKKLNKLLAGDQPKKA